MYHKLNLRNRSTGGLFLERKTTYLCSFPICLIMSEYIESETRYRQSVRVIVIPDELIMLRSRGSGEVNTLLSVFSFVACMML